VPPLLDLQPDSNTKTSSEAVTVSRPRCLREANHTQTAISNTATIKFGNRIVLTGGVRRCELGTDPRAVVVTLSVAITALALLSVTDEELGMHVDAGGALEQERLTAPVKPPSGVTVMV
jgi:hypothetical protein